MLATHDPYATHPHPHPNSNPNPSPAPTLTLTLTLNQGRRAGPQLAQLLPSQSSKGRAKGNLPSLYCNLLQYSGAFSDDGANGRPLRACALAED